LRREAAQANQLSVRHFRDLSSELLHVELFKADHGNLANKGQERSGNGSLAIPNAMTQAAGFPHVFRSFPHIQPLTGESSDLLDEANEGFESGHGRQRGSLQSLAIARKKRSRAVLAQLGLPSETTATALEAVKEALLEHMPRSEKDAMMQWELSDKANLDSLGETTVKKALQELLSAGLIQRIGKGIKGNPFLYWKTEK